MDFGKLANVDQIKFALPAFDEDPRTSAVLKESTKLGEVRVYVGGPTWICPKWVGTVYPKGKDSRDFLSFYAKQFNTVELSSSFHHIPPHDQVRRWKNKVPPDFRFSPKIHQSISHVDDYVTAKNNLRIFWESIRVFEGNLGLCFLQLPSNFSTEYLGVFQQLIRTFAKPNLLAIEFRHPSWYDWLKASPKITQPAFDFLQSQGVITVILDSAGRRDLVHSTLTTKKVMIRMIGNELHPSDYTRIEDWVERLGAWIEQGLEEVYFYIHQPTEVGVPELVRHFIEHLNARCGLSLTCWAPVQEPPENSAKKKPDSSLGSANIQLN